MLYIEMLRLSVEAAASPLTSFALLDIAASRVTFWQSDRQALVDELLAEGPRLRQLAHDLLSLPATAWWFASAARLDQLLARFPDGETRPQPPPRPPTEDERYRQEPTWGLVTSTDRDGISSYLIAAQVCSGDLGPLGFPHERFRLTPQRDARVFVVRSPEDWRRLCLAFPAPAPGGLSGTLVVPDVERAGQEGDAVHVPFGGDLVVPDFGRAGQEWDAVHVTFGGLLSSDQVRIDGVGGPTALQGWDAEQTVWMRWVFSDMARLPDLIEPIPLPLK